MPILKLKKSRKEDTDDIPDELPSIEDEPEKEEKKQEDLPPIKKKKAKLDIPEELPAISAKKSKDEAPDEKETEEVEPEENIVSTINVDQDLRSGNNTINRSGFFNEVHSQLLAKDPKKKQIAEQRLVGDTMQRMKNYWHRSVPKPEEEFVVNEKQLEEDILQLIDDLRNSETSWAELQKALRETKSQLHDKEKEIREKTALLKEKVADLKKLKQVLREYAEWKKSHVKKEK